MTVVGGFLIQMFNGSFFLWSNISIYVISYMYQFNPSINQNAQFQTNFILVLLNNCGYQIGPYLMNRLNWSPKTIIIMGSSISLIGMLLSSYATNYWTWVVLYGALSGIGCGTSYMVPLVCCWEYFPERKGMMSGIIMGAYGLGSFIYTQIASKIVNPKDELVTRDIGIKDFKLFESDVADNVPKMLRYLVIIYAC